MLKLKNSIKKHHGEANSNNNSMLNKQGQASAANAKQQVQAEHSRPHSNTSHESYSSSLNLCASTFALAGAGELLNSSNNNNNNCYSRNILLKWRLRWR